MSEEFNVLISSAGRRVALVDIFRRTLMDMGLTGRVFAADMSRASAAFHAADAGFLVPRATDREFVPTLLDLCRRERVRLVVPTVDPEQRTWARARDQFAQDGVTVAVSSPEVVEIAADKWRTHEWLTRAGLPTVRQASVDQVIADPSAWPFPLVVKPRRGTAGIGVSVAHDTEHLRYLAREVPTLVGRMIEEGKLTEEDGPGELVVQSVARGKEHTIDMLSNRRGRFLSAAVRARLEVRSGESSKGITRRVPLLHRLAEHAIKTLPGCFGVLTMQAFLDASSEATVIEINPRFGGGFPLAWEAGARFPQWMIEEILGSPGTAPGDPVREGVVMLRFDEAVFVDAATSGVAEANDIGNRVTSPDELDSRGTAAPAEGSHAFTRS